ncbi:MAG TPA: class I SAM-dependent methyltransferase [Polyangiales bacterium]|nr:class I SAM-dependent methyltransferase [Polyangiales bacterium]
MNAADGPAPRSNRACPICASASALALHDNRMAEIDGIDLSYQVVNCNDCGFAYATQLASPGQYAAYYRAMSKYDFVPSVDRIAPVDRFRAVTAVNLCRPYLRGDELVVDVGCGCGTLLAHFRDAGFSRVCGFDPSANATAAAQRLFGIDSVREGALADAIDRIDFPDRVLVCATGVLEHLLDPAADMRRLAARLPEGAYVLLEVPARERFDRSPMEPYGELSLEHVQFFGARDLATLAATAGLEPVALRLVDMDAGCTDSVFGLFRKSASSAAGLRTDDDRLADRAAFQVYLARSAEIMSHALDRLEPSRGAPWVIYGAGSHSARLLPALRSRGLLDGVVGLLDGNPHLQGHDFGGLEVQPPSALARLPEAVVVVSSFRSEAAIARAVAAAYPNRVQRLYG